MLFLQLIFEVIVLPDFFFIFIFYPYWKWSMACLQDLVGKLKDAAKSVEKASQMWCRCPVSSPLPQHKALNFSGFQRHCSPLCSFFCTLRLTWHVYAHETIIIPTCVSIKQRNKTPTSFFESFHGSAKPTHTDPDMLLVFEGNFNFVGGNIFNKYCWCHCHIVGFVWNI